MDYIIILCFFICIIATVLTQLQDDSDRINKKINRIVENLRISNSSKADNDEELKTLIYEGKRIKAIKRYRQLTGEGLKEAVDYIDSIEN